MATSNPANKARYSHPRQKSCTACVRGKRRCDQQRPVCGRCASKRGAVDCEYVDASATSSYDVHASRHFTGTVSGIWGGLDKENGVGSADVEDSFMLDRTDEVEPPLQIQNPWPAAEDPSPEMIPPNPSQGLETAAFDTTSVPTDPALQSASLGTEHTGDDDEEPPLPDIFKKGMGVHDIVLSLYRGTCSLNSMLSGKDHSTESPQIDPSKTPRIIPSLLLPELTTVSPASVKYAVDQFKSYPSLLLSTARLPFYNPHLYTPAIAEPSRHKHLPLAIQDLHCVAALYVSRNPAIHDTVHSILEDKTANLISLQRNAALEMLPCVQVLIFYQIIRLLDGDPILRSAAERDMSVLDAWTTELQNCSADFIPHTAPPDIGVNPPSEMDVDARWHHYLLAESLRRTIFTSLLLRWIYALLKQGQSSWSSGVMAASWTAQKALWEADSGRMWRKAMAEKSAFEIVDANSGLQELWERGCSTDVDELGLVLLVIFKGVDAVEEWVSRTRVG